MGFYLNKDLSLVICYFISQAPPPIVMGSSSCCKYLMFFFNMLIFLGGAAIAGIATWITVNADSFMKIVSVDDTAIFNSTYFLFISGGLLLVIGFLGCCGAMKENQCLLGMFFTFVLIAVIIEVAGAVFFAMNTEVAENAIKETMKDYGMDGQEVLTEAWNLAQAELNCDVRSSIITPAPHKHMRTREPFLYFLVLSISRVVTISHLVLHLSFVSSITE